MRTRTSPIIVTGLITVIGALLLSPTTAQSQSTVNFSAAPGQKNVVGTGASPVADGNVVRVGYFDFGFNPVASAGNLTALDGAWNEFSTTTIQTIFSQPGRFADNDSTSDNDFDSEQIWLWIFDTTNDQAPDGSYSNVEAYGLFTSSSGNWLFPDQGELPPNNTTSINSSEVNTAAYGSFDGSSLILQTIPEPASLTILLSSLGLMYVWGRRFRR